MLSLYLAALDAQSDEELFEEVYNTYKRYVYHTAYKIIGDPHLAEDVLQEVFLYVAKKFSKIRTENGNELMAYLVSCSRSRACDIMRKRHEKNHWKKIRISWIPLPCQRTQQSAVIMSSEWQS